MLKSGACGVVRFTCKEPENALSQDRGGARDRGDHRPLSNITKSKNLGLFLGLPSRANVGWCSLCFLSSASSVQSPLSNNGQ